MIKQDKILHFLAGFLLMYFFYFLMSLRDTLIIVFLIGLGKELFDYIVNKRDDGVADMLAHVIGMLLFVTILG